MSNWCSSKSADDATSLVAAAAQRRRLWRRRATSSSTTWASCAWACVSSRPTWAWAEATPDSPVYSTLVDLFYLKRLYIYIIVLVLCVCLCVLNRLIYFYRASAGGIDDVYRSGCSTTTIEKASGTRSRWSCGSDWACPGWTRTLASLDVRSFIQFINHHHHLCER